MSKFDEAFEEPFYFSHGHLMLSGKYTKSEALERFKDYDGDDSLVIEQVKADKVRFGYPPEYVEDAEKGVSTWYSGASGKGSKDVWYLD